jgi:tetratricopeptide (TPR) repeat protein
MSRNLILFLVLPQILFAHHDVQTTILELSKKIQTRPTAELFYQRALEYRALRNALLTEEDLRAALKLDPNHRGALTALILVPENPQAMELAESFLAASADPQHQLEALYLIAQVAESSGDFQVALSSCAKIEESFSKFPSEISLLHSRLLLSEKKADKAAEVLKKAYEKHQSVVLRNAWIDASLSAGETTITLPLIEHEISSSRFRASWWIRRARASLILKRPQEARADLNAALLELNSRIQPDRPDLTLIADRGLALALLGSKTLARRDLEQLKASTLSKSAYIILSSEIEAPGH